MWRMLIIIDRISKTITIKLFLQELSTAGLHHSALSSPLSYLLFHGVGASKQMEAESVFHQTWQCRASLSLKGITVRHATLVLYAPLFGVSLEGVITLLSSGPLLT